MRSHHPEPRRSSGRGWPPGKPAAIHNLTMLALPTKSNEMWGMAVSLDEYEPAARDWRPDLTL